MLVNEVNQSLSSVASGADQSDLSGIVSALLLVAMGWVGICGGCISSPSPEYALLEADTRSLRVTTVEPLIDVALPLFDSLIYISK